MKIPFFSKKEDKNKFYLGIFLKETEAVGFSIVEQPDGMVIEEYEKFQYSNGWDNIYEDIDEMLIRLEGKTKRHFKETIFFVYSHFIDKTSKQIKKEYLAVIKKLVKSIELTPLGYIEVYEAVAKFLEERDEAPLTAIVTELDKSNAGLFIYKGGKLVFSNELVRSENIIGDIERTLEEFHGKMVLPARIVLYNSHDLDDLSTQLMTHRWKEDFFIQLPKVETISENELHKSLVHIFEEQVLGKVIQKTHDEESDTLEEMMLEEESKEVIEEKAEEKNAEVMGFVVGQDVEEEPIPPAEPISVIQPVQPSKLKSMLSSIKNRMSHIKSRIRLPSKSPVVLYVGIGIFVVFALIFINEFFFHKARLTVYLPSQVMTKSLDISAPVVSLGTQSDTFSVVIASKSAAFSEKAVATGKKDVGTSAKGDVTLYNLEDTAKTFDKGTTLTTGSLSYTLDSAVEVPAGSIDSNTNESVPGKAKASVTASDIGPDSNLEKGKRFKIGDLSSTIYYGINDAPIGGGVKKQIQIVSQKDVDALTSKIEAKAKAGESNMPQGIDSSMKVISSLSQSDLTNIKINPDVGEEANNFTVNAKAVSEYYFYNNDEVLKTISDNLSAELDSGFVLKNSNISYSIKKATKKNNTISLTLNVDAKGVKDVRPSEIQKSILFKDKADLERYLKGQIQAERFNLINQEPLFIFGNFLPLFSNNITVEVSNL